ncbi:MAG: hypothetical protein RMM29_08190 [Planctomycetota bacterium]|nr:hypothetical protein [Planctomycetota bacterium]MCX8039192.1 hypothetical protein [Planctomycetota bacterium]MDW8373606.1 hypothetical protein [Planctomycetota bacterium]
MNRHDLLNDRRACWSTIGQVEDLAELWAAARSADASERLRQRAEWVRRRVAPTLAPFAAAAEAPRGAAVLTTGSGQRGALGFVSASSGESARWQHLVDAVWRWVGEQRTALLPVFQVAAQTQGDSLGLSLWLAMLAAAYGLPDPADSPWASTGALEIGDGRLRRLRPVPAETLPAKAAAARRFGYQRLLVVEDQECPADLGIDIVRLPADPACAQLRALELLWRAAPWERIAAALDAIDRRLLQRSRPAELATVQNLVAPWLEDRRPLLAALAAHLCSSAALHHGQTALARTFQQACEERLAEARRQRQWPAGRFGDLLEGRLFAHRAIIALDAGLWDEDDDSVWQRLPRLIDEHAREAHRPERAFQALCLRNAYGRWLEYRGRLRGDPALLAQSWARRTAEHDDWPRLFDFARDQLGEANSTLERQHHQCIDVLASWHALHGRLPERGELPDPDWRELSLWPELGPPAWERLTDFGLLYALQWRALRRTCSEDDAAAAWARAERLCAGSGWRYPYFLIAECLLRYRLGDAALQARAAAALASAPELFPGPERAERHSVFCLLALRAGALLGAAAPPRAHWCRPPAGSALARLCAEIAADPIRRAPY